MEEMLNVREAEVESLRKYHTRVSTIANKIDSRRWTILPQLRKEDAELIDKLIKEARDDTSQDQG